MKVKKKCRLLPVLSKTPRVTQINSPMKCQHRGIFSGTFLLISFTFVFIFLTQTKIHQLRLLWGNISETDETFCT